LKLAWHNGWFRLEFEWFSTALTVSSSDLVPRRERLLVRRKLLQDLALRLAQQGPDAEHESVSAEEAHL
jgi:hypothetical protein